jgi:hypothetical protein
VNDDELDAMVLEAMKVPPIHGLHYPLAPNQLRYLIDRVIEDEREKEREACAKVCDAERALWNSSREALIAGFCAAAIRARGEGK